MKELVNLKGEGPHFKLWVSRTIEKWSYVILERVLQKRGAKRVSHSEVYKNLSNLDRMG